MSSTAETMTDDAPRHLKRRMPLRFRPWLSHDAWSDVMDVRPHGGRFRAVRRIVFALLWTLLASPVQAVLLLLPGRPKIVFVRWYFAVLCWLIGLRIQVVGAPARGPSVLYLSNHSSWVDILVLGAVLDGAFVAKAEVGQWPVVGWLSSLRQTVYVSRKRGSTGGEADAMRERLGTGQNLILFPEGTSNDGTRTLPFRSSFLSIADKARTVQPISLVYDRVGGLPACRRDRPIFAWYGDMEMGAHAWRLLRRPGMRATVLMHEATDPAAFANRKVLTAAVQQVVADGASLLRQNRKVAPIAVPGAKAVA